MEKGYNGHLLSEDFPDIGAVLPENILLVEDVQSDRLQNGHIYFLPGSAPFEAIKEILDARVYSALEKGSLIYGYEFESVGDFCKGNDSGHHIAVEDCVGLPEEVRCACESGYDLVLPLFTPLLSTKAYLMTVSGDDIAGSVSSLITTAEKIGRILLENAVVNMAVNDPEGCEYLLFSDHSTPLEEQTQCPSEPCFPLGMIGRFFLSSPPICAALPVGSALLPDDVSFESFEEEVDGRADFLNNCKIYKRKHDTVALRKIKCVIKDLDWYDLLRFIDTLPKREKERFVNEFIDRIGIGNRTKVKVNIKKFNSSVPTRQNDGIYRIYLHKDGYDPKLLHFETKAQNILYMMYLIDRQKKGDGVSAISLPDNKDSFKSLYEKVYADVADRSKIENECRHLVSVPESLRQCYNGINRVLKNTLADLDEPYQPFRLLKFSHITLPAENISLPDELSAVKII